MSKIRSSNTEFEKLIFRKLRRRGVGFKTNHRSVIGKPDIAIPSAKKAIFLHSDFWHGWQLPRWEKTLPNVFWKEKLKQNRTRDKKVVRSLRHHGWRVMVVWEHQIKRNLDGVVNSAAKFLKE